MKKQELSWNRQVRRSDLTAMDLVRVQASREQASLHATFEQQDHQPRRTTRCKQAANMPLRPPSLPQMMKNLKISVRLLSIVVIVSLATLCAASSPNTTLISVQKQYYKLQRMQPNASKELPQEAQVRSPRSPAAQVADVAANRHRQAHFVEPEGDSASQRVAVGRSVRFKCVVTDIGDHVVAWFHKDRRILLAIDNKTVAWRDRIQVSSQANSVFFLQIDSVQLSDKGHYVCQLNTQPMQSQTHVLDVVKSPQIKEQETTINMEPVKEFSSVELKCVADGIPKPVIKWRRESQTFELPILYEEEHENELDSGGGGGSGKVLEGSEKTGDNVRQQTANDLADGGRVESPSTPSRVARGARLEDNGDGAYVSKTRNQHGTTPAIGRQFEVFNEHSPSGFSSVVMERPRKGEALSAPNFGKENSSPVDGAHCGREVGRRRRSRPSVKAAAAAAAASASPQLGAPETADSSSANASAGALNGAAPNSSSNSKPFIAEGEVLRIERVTRYDMGFYMCIASNGVPPSVSQRIFLRVSFARSYEGSEMASGSGGGQNSSTQVAQVDQGPYLDRGGQSIFGPSKSKPGLRTTSGQNRVVTSLSASPLAKSSSQPSSSSASPPVMSSHRGIGRAAAAREGISRLQDQQRAKASSSAASTS